MRLRRVVLLIPERSYEYDFMLAVATSIDVSARLVASSLRIHTCSGPEL